MIQPQGEIILYQPDETIRLEVRMEDDTVWLNQAQMGELFNATKQNISLHIKNIYDEGELEELATVKDYLTVRKEGNTEHVGQSHLHLQQLNQQQFRRRIEIKEYNNRFHDRFLVLDDALYHFGASFKDLGKRLFAFEQMGIDKEMILNQL